MPTDAAENEPSMEEILASIRRIIDEDEDGGDAEAAAESPAAEEPAEEAAPEPAPEPAAEAPAEPEPVAEAPAEPEVADDDEVLELTDKIDEVGGGTDPLALDDDLMIVDREDDAPAPQPEPEPEPVAEAAPEPAPAPQPAAEEDDSLVGAPAATAAAGAFDALAENLRVASADGLTLEGIVREMMRPMLKDWLDTNLPRIVEEKVEAEIERIARRR
ncbi:MAG: DUF2497 domain-containing protein [Alphaproteobacteria bacterium]|nr:DUF2497 domain-containing protein [Alphaproteobacteria bacterium]